MVKFNEILDNYINGNISDFKKQAFKLPKRELMELSHYAFEYVSPSEAREIIKMLSRGK